MLLQPPEGLHYPQSVEQLLTEKDKVCSKVYFHSSILQKTQRIWRKVLSMRVMRIYDQREGSDSMTGDSQHCFATVICTK